MESEEIAYHHGIGKEDGNHSFERRCKEMKKKIVDCCSACMCVFINLIVVLIIFSAIGGVIYGIIYASALDNCK